MITEPLDQKAINEALKTLSEWSFDNDALTKTFKLKNFRQAIAFMVAVAFEAEELNHHPSLHNVYNKVEIHLNTHDSGSKVTQKDVALAQKIEAIAQSCSK